MSTVISTARSPYESASSEKPFNHNIPTLIRFIAITLIVASHFGAVSYGSGGALLLMMMVGYNIATFKIAKVIKTSSIKTVAVMVLKVAIPTVIYALLLHITFGPFRWIDITLISNFFEVHHPSGFSFWFIEVYVQILAGLMIVLSIPAVREALDKHPKNTTLIFVIISSFIFIIADLNWNTENLYGRLPWLMLWLVAFGVAARYVETLKEKLTLSLLFLLMNFAFGFNYFLFIGGLFLVFNPTLILTETIKKPVYYIAAGSLFIYITHFQFSSILEALGFQNSYIHTAFAIVMGAVTFDIYNRLINQKLINKL